MAGLVDSHLHLAREEFEGEREEIRHRARAAGVAGFLHVGFDRPSIAAALAEAEGRQDEWVSAGIHPHDAATWDAEAEALLEGLAREGRVVAIGECGLDFYRDLSPRERQEEAFTAQIALAKRCGLPLVMHVRDAYAEVREILRREGPPRRRGVFHAFAGDAEFARWAVDEGFVLGIGGPLTYKRARLPEAVAGLPPQSFVLETDAPWLPPQPWRGRRNEPAYLRHTAERLAALCGIDVDELARITTETFARLFALSPSPALRAVRPSALPAPQGRSR